MATISHSVKVWLPIAVSILSLLFGAFQYFDKRGVERSLQEQQLRLNSADLIVYYLDTDLKSVLIGRHADLVSATTRWIEGMEKHLEVGDLKLQESVVLLEIARALGANEIVLTEDNPQLSFLLIRNTGRSNAVDISLTDEVSRETLKLGVIEPNHGVMIPIGLYELRSGNPLSLQILPDLLKYTDSSTGRPLTNKVRSKLRSPRFVAPRVRLML